MEKQGSQSFSHSPCFVVYEEAEEVIFDLVEQTASEAGSLIENVMAATNMFLLRD